MSGIWHREEMPEIVAEPGLTHQIEVYREGFATWSVRVRATDGVTRRCWVAGVTATHWGGMVAARRVVRRATKDVTRYRCDIIRRLGWCTGIRCWRHWWVPHWW